MDSPAGSDFADAVQLLRSMNNSVLRWSTKQSSRFLIPFGGVDAFSALEDDFARFCEGVNADFAEFPLRSSWVFLCGTAKLSFDRSRRARRSILSAGVTSLKRQNAPIGFIVFDLA